MKEQLPRIRYANPALDIQVEKVKKGPSEAWRPELELEFGMSEDMHALPTCFADLFLCF